MSRSPSLLRRPAPDPDGARPPEQCPFVLEQRRLFPQPDGSFTPATVVYLTPSLRSSHLLAQVPAEELKTLLALFSCVHPNGHCQASLSEMAQVLGCSPARTKTRLGRLLTLSWEGKPLIREIKRPQGLDTFAPAPHLYAISDAASNPDSASGPALPGSRDAVLAYSRAHYARPRAEVEAEIARQMGWEEPDDPQDTQARERHDALLRLRFVGIAAGEAKTLLERFGLERVRRQLAWLPYRRAKNPARLLTAAIAGDYAQPVLLTLRDREAKAAGSDIAEKDRHA